MKDMDQDVDRSGLFDEIRKFSQRKLKKVETKVTTGSGEAVTEKRSAKGVQTVKSEGIQGAGYVVDNKPDLQVGMIIPGMFISSQDVAHEKKLLDTYEITHILNLAYGVANAFEDDYNYKTLEILDVPETDIRKYFDECFEFIDDARHYGNCLVHCNAGVSRCTTICTAYLMHKEKMTFTDALNAVREARPFSKPNAGFMKQLEAYNEELFGGGKIDQKVEDAFTARKRAEIEAEKAAISGASSVKNKLKTFGAQLDAHFADRARSISPMNLPLKKKPPTEPDRKVPIPEPPKPRPKQEPQKPKPEPPKPKQEPLKKLIISNDISKRQVNDSETSPNIDETPISVSAHRKQFELNKQNEIPKVQKTPATPKTNAITNNPWNRPQQQTAPVAAPEERKKKIIIKQRSKEVPEEQPKRRSTKDLVDAIERVNSPTAEQKPYGRRRTTQLVDNNSTVSNNIAKKPIDMNQKPIDNKQQPYRRRNNEFVREPPPAPAPPPPPPVIPQEKTTPRTIKLNKQTPTSSPAPTPPPPVLPQEKTTPRTIKVNKQTPTSSPAPSTPSRSPQPPVSHSPSPTPYSQQSDSSQPAKTVFGRVPPRRLSITGRTLSQASQNISDVSNNDSTTSSISGRHSASNSRSESPVLSAVVKANNDRQRETGSQEKTRSHPSSSTANKLSDNMVSKRTALSSLKSQPNVKSCTPSSSSVSESSDEEVAKIVPKHTSTLTMKLNTNKNNNNINKDNKEPEIKPRKDVPLTQTKETKETKEPSIDNPIVNSKRVPLGETKDRQQSFDRKLQKSKSGLTRSSTAEILKLIKTKSRHDLGLERVEEDDEIESLLLGLEKEGIDNVDWDELGVDYDEVKDIVDNAKTATSSEDSSDDEDSDDEEAVHMVINRQAPEQESDDSDDDFEVVDDEEEEESN